MRVALSVIASLALTGSALAQTPAPSPGSPAAAAPAPAPTPAASNITTTRDLVALCNTAETDPTYPGAIGLCVGYGSGVLAYHLADTRAHTRARKVCLPSPPPSRGEARRLFVAWAQSNDRYMDEPAVDGVMRFLITTYPCRR